MLTISENTTSRIPPIEPGPYPAVCYGLIDLGEQFSETYQKWTRKILLMWELPGEIVDTGAGEPGSRVISQKYTASLNERSALRRDLVSWRGRDFTEAELKAFDLRNIVGAPCLLNIVNREYNGSTYANISSIMKLPKNMPIDTPSLAHVVFDLDTDDLAMVDQLPEWIGKQIKESRQYKERSAGKPKCPEGVDEYDDAPEDEVPF